MLKRISVFLVICRNSGTPPKHFLRYTLFEFPCFCSNVTRTHAQKEENGFLSKPDVQSWSSVYCPPA